MPSLEYLKTYGSQNTIRNYSLAIKRFLKVAYQKEIVNGDMEKFADLYISDSDKRDAQKDVDAFMVSMKDRAPKTARLEVAAVKMFLLENGVELPQLYWRQSIGKIKGSRALTLDKVPSNVELKRIIMNMPAQGKALYLVLESSGMRIGETLQLKLNDIDLDKEPSIIGIKGEYSKTGNSRIAFISHEAKEFLRDWLRLRQDYIETAARKSSRNAKSTKDDRIFPFDFPTAYSLWDKAIMKAGLKEMNGHTNRSRMHPHVLRKFFRTRLGAVIPVDITEALMGHEGYLTEVYRKYGQEELAEFYRKGESTLAVFSNGAEVLKLKIEVEEKSKILNEGMATLALKNDHIEEKNADLENRLTALIADNQGMKGSLQDVKGELQDLKSRMASIERLAKRLEGIEEESLKTSFQTSR